MFPSKLPNLCISIALNLTSLLFRVWRTQGGSFAAIIKHTRVKTDEFLHDYTPPKKIMFDYINNNASNNGQRDYSIE